MIELQDLRFHHFGLAASDPERAVKFVGALGYECGSPVYDPLQNVNLYWCSHSAAPAIEIVSPVGREGPLARILAEQPSSFYHLCYEVGVETSIAIEAIRSMAGRLITVVPPQPAVLFGGRRVSFHVVQGFGLIELLEAEHLAGEVL